MKDNTNALILAFMIFFVMAMEWIILIDLTIKQREIMDMLTLIAERVTP